MLIAAGVLAKTVLGETCRKLNVFIWWCIILSYALLDFVLNNATGLWLFGYYQVSMAYVFLKCFKINKMFFNVVET